MKNLENILVIITLLQLFSCKTNIILVDDSEIRVKTFHINEEKLEKANHMIIDFEKQTKYICIIK